MGFPEPAFAADLGPVLLNRKVARTDALVFMGTGGVRWIAAALAVYGWEGVNAGLSWTLVGAAVLGMLGTVIFVIGFGIYWSKRGRRQFVCERGLREESPRGSVSIAYDEADELEYRVTDLHHNGVYVGTVDHFVLRTAGIVSQEIADRRVRRKRDEPTPLPPIVEAISARLARRLAETIERGKSVLWT